MNVTDAIIRLFDITITLLTSIVWLPVCALVSLVLVSANGCPVLYLSDRAGRDGKPFKFLKFRTMREGAGSDAERLTRLGRFLRATSLDELPQLFHVLAGTMALVGPRPLPVCYLPRYTAEQRHRHDVPPGITGWAQVNGRNALDWEEKFKLDLWYVNHRSLALNAKILAMTVAQALARRNIAHAGCETMYEFKGTNHE